MSIVNKPHTFSPSTTAASSQVNDNFDTLYNNYNGGITAANLASDSVVTAKIADSNVTTAKIADGGITTAKISASAALIKKSTSQNSTNGSATAITFDGEDLDTAGYHTTGGSNSRMTVPTAGLYLFIANVSWTPNATGVRGAWFGKNGTSTARHGVCVINNVGAATSPSVCISTVFNLGAADYVEVFAVQGSGGDLTIVGDDTAVGITYAEIVRLGT